MLSSLLKQSECRYPQRSYHKTTKCSGTNPTLLPLQSNNKTVAEINCQTRDGVTYEEKIMRADGVTYYFGTTNKNGKIKIGETWSPNEKSLLGNLIKICDNIYSLGNGNDLSQSDILKDIDKLLNDLKQ